MPTSNYKTIIDTVIDEEVTRIEVCLDLHSISPEQYTSEGEGKQPTPGVTDVETTEVVECWAGNDNSEFPVNTNYIFRDNISAETAYIPIYCDVGIVKCEINFNASSSLLNMFDIFTSTNPLATAPESKYNRYTGDKDVYVFFKCKISDDYSIYSPGISQSGGYTFAKGQSRLIRGNRGEIGHICRIEEPIPKEVLAAAIDRTRMITVNLIGMEVPVWNSVATSSPQEIRMNYSSAPYRSLEGVVSNLNYEPKCCYALMGTSAGEIEFPRTQYEDDLPFPSTSLTKSGTILNMPIVNASSIAKSLFDEMATIATVDAYNGTIDYRIGMFYNYSNNVYYSGFYTYYSVNSSTINSTSVYVLLSNIYVSRFDDAIYDRR